MFLYEASFSSPVLEGIEGTYLRGMYPSPQLVCSRKPVMVLSCPGGKVRLFFHAPLDSCSTIFSPRYMSLVYLPWIEPVAQVELLVRPSSM